MTARFKIDTYGSLFPFALYVKRVPWIGFTSWNVMRYFDTIAECRAHYEIVKDLPEYLT